MNNNLKLSEIANILSNEATLLNSTLKEAWSGIHTDITNKFNFKEVESYIFNNIKQCNI